MMSTYYESIFPIVIFQHNSNVIKAEVSTRIFWVFRLKFYGKILKNKE